MRDAATLLRMLVDAGETAIGRPRVGGVDELVQLHLELQHAAPNHPDPKGGLLIDIEALLLAQVIAQAARQRSLGDERRARLLQQLAGVLMPPVREALWRAIEVRRDERPTP